MNHCSVNLNLRNVWILCLCAAAGDLPTERRSNQRDGVPNAPQ